MGLFRSLYVHFPFCESKCHYCDFYSIGRERTRSEDGLHFERALHQEAERWAHRFAPLLETVFFGGGTPSMTPVDSMKRALEPLWRYTSVSSEIEWTMEANPSSLTLDSLQEYRAYGVNRISMGIQALRPDLLTRLGRVHSRKTALSALEAIFEAGFENVSVDLLCGVPGQELSDIEEALEILTQYPISHLSCYLLTLAKHHRMYPELPDENRQLEHLLFVDQFMRGRGFDHYEVSNYARPGRRARHNLNYWKGVPYLGLGPSAHSFDGKKRWKNLSSLHLYKNRLEQQESVIEWEETLTPAQCELEKWMLALRLDDGFPTQWLVSASQKNRSEVLKAEGYLESHPAISENLRLTAKGFALSDQIIASLSLAY